MAGRPKVAERFAALAGPEEELLWLGLQAIADPIRLSIVRLLREREQCVCHLTETLGLSQPTISYHMSALKRAGLIEDRRDTRWTYYRLSPGGVSSLRQSIDELLDANQVESCLPASCQDICSDKECP